MAYTLTELTHFLPFKKSGLYLTGWFFVWKMFLIRFSFIRELVYGSSNGSAGKTKSDIPPTPLRRSSRIRDLRARKS